MRTTLISELAVPAAARPTAPTAMPIKGPVRSPIPRRERSPISAGVIDAHGAVEPSTAGRCDDRQAGAGEFA